MGNSCHWQCVTRSLFPLHKTLVLTIANNDGQQDRASTGKDCWFSPGSKVSKTSSYAGNCGMRHFLRSIFMLRVFCTTRWHPCWSVPDLNHVGLCDFRSWTVSLISALSASRPISLTMSSERCLASKWQHSCPIWICVSYEVTTPPTFAGLLLSNVVQLQDYEDSDTSSACWAIWVFP